MSEGTDTNSDAKTGISLYEFYALGIERLLVRAPWELERAVSAYHESFLTEQRCLGLSILLLLGETQVPEEESMQVLPGFESHARISVNQAVFLRALRDYFAASSLNQVRADMVLERMQSYLINAREPEAQDTIPLGAMSETLMKRVPPKDEEQQTQYAERVEKIYEYVYGLVAALLKRYEVMSQADRP